MKIFYWYADEGGSGYYRMALPAKYLSQRPDIDVRLKMSISTDDIEWADIVVIQRRCHKEILNIIKENKDTTKFVYEIDDDIWSIPSTNPGKKFWNDERLQGAEDIMRECHGVITSTKYLASVISSKLNSKIYIIPNFVEAPTIQRQEIKKDKIIIGWFGSPSHCVDFDKPILTAIRNIKYKYQDKVEFMFFGWVPEEIRDIVTFIAWQEVNQFLNILYMSCIDIGLIVNADIKFNKSRSNLKFLEYTVSRIISVADEKYHPKDSACVRVRNNEWESQLSYVINNLAFYKRTLLKSAMESLDKYWLMENNIKKIENVFKGF